MVKIKINAINFNLKIPLSLINKIVQRYKCFSKSTNVYNSDRNNEY